MSVEMLTYAALGARLKISPEAARALAKRHRLPRSLSPDGKAVVSVDLAEIRHTPAATKYPPGRQHRSANDKDRGVAGGNRAARSRDSGSSGRFRARTRAGRPPNDGVTPGDRGDHGGQGSDGAA